MWFDSLTSNVLIEDDLLCSVKRVGRSAGSQFPDAIARRSRLCVIR